MKFLIILAVVFAVASAQYGTIVKGPKTIVDTPAGRVFSDAGTIVKDPLALRADLPLVRHIDPLGFGGRSWIIPGHTLHYF